MYFESKPSNLMTINFSHCMVMANLLMCYFKQRKDCHNMADKTTLLQKLALPSKTATKRTDMRLCPRGITVHFRNKCKVIV